MRLDSLGAFEIALLIGGMAFITLLTRSFFVFLGARVRVPADSSGNSICTASSHCGYRGTRTAFTPRSGRNHSNGLEIP